MNRTLFIGMLLAAPAVLAQVVEPAADPVIEVAPAAGAPAADPLEGRVPATADEARRAKAIQLEELRRKGFAEDHPLVTAIRAALGLAPREVKAMPLAPEMK